MSTPPSWPWLKHIISSTAPNLQFSQIVHHKRVTELGSWSGRQDVDQNTRTNELTFLTPPQHGHQIGYQVMTSPICLNSVWLQWSLNCLSYSVNGWNIIFSPFFNAHFGTSECEAFLCRLYRRFCALLIILPKNSQCLVIVIKHHQRREAKTPERKCTNGNIPKNCKSIRL